jgi:hypothetical protein
MDLHNAAVTRPAWDGPVVWPSFADYKQCDCMLVNNPSFGPHLEKEHTNERCSGSWGWDPPCGGCINCILAQAAYYEHKYYTKEQYGYFTWWYFQLRDKLRKRR